MDEIRKVMLSLCLYTSIAGLVSCFLPENGWKTVINGVLSLYILVSLMNMVFQELPAFSFDFFVAEGNETEAEEQSYIEELGREATGQAVLSALEQRGIDARAEWQGDTCVIFLKNGSDTVAAEAVLKECCGTMAYRLEAEEEKQ